MLMGIGVTNNRDIAERVEMLSNHGCKEKYYNLIPSFNSRLDSLQATVLRVKLKHLDRWIKKQRQKVASYSRLISEISSVEPLLEAPYSYRISNYHTVRLRNSEVSHGNPKLLLT